MSGGAPPLAMQQQPHVDLRPWFQTLDDLAPPLDWPAFYGNDNPVEIDVGCGRGMFIVNAATSHPDRNYLGIEVDFREGRHGAKRLKRRNLTNARILGADVKFVFETYVRPGSVSAVHVYFPDPWWKKRHRRRRVFTDYLVKQMAQVLQPGGFVHSWTDVGEYFEVISALMNHSDDFESLPSPAEREAEHDLDYQTSFERRKRQDGCKIWRGLWRRKGERGT